MADSAGTNGNAAETKSTGKAAATKRSTGAKRAASTRARNSTVQGVKAGTTAKKVAETRSLRSKTPLEHATAYLERCIASPTETARAARSAVVSGVEELRGSLRSPDKLARDLAARRKDAERLAARLEPIVQRGFATGTRFATRVQSRIATLR